MMIVFLTLYITWVESGCIRYEECRIVTGSGDKSQLLSGGEIVTWSSRFLTLVELCGKVKVLPTYTHAHSRALGG